MVYIYSTIPHDVEFPVWKKGVDLPRKVHSITINGGAGVVSKKHLHTPRGVVTIITEDDYKILKENKSFCRKVERGFLKVEHTQKDADEVGEKMNEAPSAPLTPQNEEKRLRKR